jgi:hypothetical protein
MPPSPRKGATQGIRSVRAAESRCRMAAVCARLNRPSRFALEGPDLATAAGRVRFPRTRTLHPAGEGGGSTMPQSGRPRTKETLLTGHRPGLMWWAGTGSNRRPCGFQPGATHPDPSGMIRLSHIPPDQQGKGTLVIKAAPSSSGSVQTGWTECWQNRIARSGTDHWTTCLWPGVVPRHGRHLNRQPLPGLAAMAYEGSQADPFFPSIPVSLVPMLARSGRSVACRSTCTWPPPGCWSGSP